MQHDEDFQSENNQARSRRPGAATRDHERPAVAGWRGEALKGVATANTVLSMQRLAGNAAVVQMLSESDLATELEESSQPDQSPVLDVVGRGGGEPLDKGTRLSMERALDTDLSDVRIHQDAAAGASAAAVNAHAYTVGNEVVFQSGKYEPETTEGRRMLAHELTHVVQQRSGPVEGTATGDGIAVSDPDDRFERAAEASADRIVGAASASGAAAHAPASVAGVAQRAMDDELEGEEIDAEENLAQAEEQVAEIQEEELEEEE
jgi:hypothetical protein